MIPVTNDSAIDTCRPAPAGAAPARAGAAARDPLARRHRRPGLAALADQDSSRASRPPSSPSASASRRPACPGTRPPRGRRADRRARAQRTAGASGSRSRPRATGCWRAVAQAPHGVARRAPERARRRRARGDRGRASSRSSGCWRRRPSDVLRIASRRTFAQPAAPPQLPPLLRRPAHVGRAARGCRTSRSPGWSSSSHRTRAGSRSACSPSAASGRSRCSGSSPA